MNLFTDDLTSILTYSFLYLTVISLWIPKFKKFPLWIAILTVSIIFGLISQRVEFIGLFFILLFSVATYCLKNQKLPMLVRVLFAIVIFILGAGLEAHLFPGFQNLKVLDSIKISKDGIPFTLYLNFEKTFVGIFILGVLHQLISAKDEWLKMFKIMLPKAILVIFVVACVSFVLKFVRFDIKIPSSFFIWSCTNLLFVCVAEEAFFRGFIQKYLCLILRRFHYGNLSGVIIASILFGLAHYTGGIRYVILAAFAGMGYGWIYFRTKRIEASIITHFSLNLVHFLFFTYPALVTSVA
jgi:membrane protease YdiL (CAAX protease family)